MTASPSLEKQLSAEALRKVLSPSEEIDNFTLKLTEEELEVLTSLLENERACTTGELQRMVNVGREKKIAWRRMENILSVLKHHEIIEEEKELPNEKEGRAKSRIFLSPLFMSRWRTRRLEILQLCSQFKNLSPYHILGNALTTFYLVGNVRAEKNYARDKSKTAIGDARKMKKLERFFENAPKMELAARKSK